MSTIPITYRPPISIEDKPELVSMWKDYQQVFDGITYTSFQNKYSVPNFDNETIQRLQQAGATLATIPPYPSSFDIHMITVCFHTHTEISLPKLVQTFNTNKIDTPFQDVTIVYKGNITINDTLCEDTQCTQGEQDTQRTQGERHDRRGQALCNNQATMSFMHFGSKISTKVFLNGAVQIAGPKRFVDFYSIIVKIEQILWLCRDAMTSPQTFHISDIRTPLINSSFQLGFQFDQEKLKDLIHANEANLDAIYKYDPAVGVKYVSKYYNISATNRWGQMAWTPITENGKPNMDESQWTIHQIGVPAHKYILPELIDAIQKEVKSTAENTDIRCMYASEGKYDKVWLYAHRPFVLFSKRTCELDRTEPKHRESIWKLLGFQKRKRVSQYDSESGWWYLQTENPVSGSEVTVRLFKGRDAEKKGSVIIIGCTPYEIRDAYHAIQYAFYKYYDQIVFGKPRPYDYFLNK